PTPSTLDPRPSTLVFTTQSGLPANQITALAQDAAGRLWIAASPTNRTGQQSAGLSRFDGTSFINYSAADGLLGSVVTALRTDDTGGLWLATPSGVMRFDSQTVATFDGRDGLDPGVITDIAVTSDHAAWFLADQKLSRYNGREIQKLTQAEGLSGAPLNSLFVDTNRDLLVTATGSPIARYLPSETVSNRVRFPILHSYE